MPTRTQSLRALTNYLGRIRQAIDARHHHDQRRAILIDLLRDGFGLSVEDIELEHNVTVAKTRGRIDLVYRALAWEVKRDLDRERADLERELRLYLSDLGPGSIGLATDGLRFEAYYIDDDGNLKKIDEHKVDEEEDGAAPLLDWLDSYIFLLEDVAATSESVLDRFGLNSAVFRAASTQLTDMWRAVQPDDTATLKRDEWERLLEVVYGQQVGSDELWIRHTYLVMVARLLAYLTIVGRLPPQHQELGLLTGDLFTPLGLKNLVERDFFAWPDVPAASEQAQTMLRSLGQHLLLFSLDSIDEDLLKEMYEHLVDPREREWLGEFYTPDWLADKMLEQVGFSESTRMLDPSCGSGTFLFAAIRRLRESGLSGARLVRVSRENVIGIDIHPLAVTISRVNYLLALRTDIRQMRTAFQIPVYMADTLAAPSEGFGRVIEIDAPVHRIPEAPSTLPKKFRLPTVEGLTQSLDHETLLGLLSSFSDPALDSSQAEAGFTARLATGGVGEYEIDLWRSNLELLRELRKNRLNTIWNFVLGNALQPQHIAGGGVDLIIGNPPWLTVMEMAGPAYKDRVKRLARQYNLVPRRGSRMGNISHIDTATVFAAYCISNFLTLREIA